MIENNKSKSIYPQGTLICPVCGKEFEANDDTRYIVAGGYTCSWKCFLKEDKRLRDKKVLVNKQKHKSDKN